MLQLEKEVTRVLENSNMVECKTLFSFALVVSLNPFEGSQIYLHGHEKETICNRIFRVRCKNHFLKLHLLNIVGLVQMSQVVNSYINTYHCVISVTEQFFSLLF